MVAEKPSLAQSIAKILSGGNMTTRKGINGACSIHEYRGTFSPTKEMANFKMTSVCGHVFGIDFMGKYNNWDKVDPVCNPVVSEHNIYILHCICVHVALKNHLSSPLSKTFFIFRLSRIHTIFFQEMEKKKN